MIELWDWYTWKLGNSVTCSPCAATTGPQFGERIEAHDVGERGAESRLAGPTEQVGHVGPPEPCFARLQKQVTPGEALGVNRQHERRDASSEIGKGGV
ncbi:hypothetical protein [Salinispora arenicola]|uniref:hypothetical protein n=1 Tax=Salinispora arenicola TaxID=168697 RepID=UPI00168DA09A|nr:hypothetical protein [Salinispora arenicola]NIL64755.1 hypothetical protein [Salinispora arenicola]